MSYTYELTIDDMMIYQKELILSKVSPSIEDSICRWEKMVLMSLVLFCPAIILLAFKNIVLCLSVAFVGFIGFILFRKNSTISYWNLYKEKARKDLLMTYFNNNELSSIQYELNLSLDFIEIESKILTKKILKDDIDMYINNGDYIFFYTSNHDASYIPLSKLSDEKEIIIKWFDSIE